MTFVAIAFADHYDLVLHGHSFDAGAVVIADLNFLDQLVRKLQCNLGFALFGAFGAVNLERVDRGAR